LGDNYGNVYHCFERECSIQRRHQKVLEETPSYVLNSMLRRKMTACAVKIGKLIQYRGAATIEFIFVSLPFLSFPFLVFFLIFKHKK